MSKTLESAKGKNRAYVKYCFVPLCTSSSAKNPEKHLFPVPRDLELRRKWWEIARRSDTIETTKTAYFCCEDHFNVRNNQIIFFSDKTKVIYISFDFIHTDRRRYFELVTL